MSRTFTEGRIGRSEEAAFFLENKQRRMKGVKLRCMQCFMKHKLKGDYGR